MGRLEREILAESVCAVSSPIDDIHPVPSHVTNRAPNAKHSVLRLKVFM